MRDAPEADSVVQVVPWTMLRRRKSDAGNADCLLHHLDGFQRDVHVVVCLDGEEDEEDVRGIVERIG